MMLSIPRRDWREEFRALASSLSVALAVVVALGTRSDFAIAAQKASSKPDASKSNRANKKPAKPAAKPAPPAVSLEKTPKQGIQPQAAIGADGALHLIFFSGENDRAGDLFYARREKGQSDFSAPLRVNSVSGSACAVGTVRGGQLALGRNDRPHVAWNSVGMAYSRLADSGDKFEDERDLMEGAEVLDGGGTVAADREGNVYVAFQALAAGSKRGEEGRKPWIARSHDDGATFTNAMPAWTEPTGACGCCSTRAFADSKGAFYFLYRSAKAEVNRDMYLLRSSDQGQSVQGVMLDAWNVNICPMSTMAFAEGASGVLAAWETKGQVFFGKIQADSSVVKRSSPAPEDAQDRKHPTLAIDSRGNTLLAWTEGTGWERGGDLAWQVFDSQGQPIGAQGRLEKGIPVWGLPTAVATDSGFIIVH